MMNKRITIVLLILILLAGFAFTTYGAPNEPDSLTLLWDLGSKAIIHSQFHPLGKYYIRRTTAGRTTHSPSLLQHHPGRRGVGRDHR
jgi:hypothetical protein